MRMQLTSLQRMNHRNRSIDYRLVCIPVRGERIPFPVLRSWEAEAVNVQDETGGSADQK